MLGRPAPGGGPRRAGRGRDFRRTLSWRPDPTGRRAVRRAPAQSDPRARRGHRATDVDILRAAILHDVVADTAATLDQIRERFGDRVATLVDWVTKPPAREGEGRAYARSAYLERLRGAPDDSILVKLADRLSNVQRLDTHPRPKKRADYYRETVRSIVPLAQRHPWFRDWYGRWRVEFRWLGEQA